MANDVHLVDKHLLVHRTSFSHTNTPFAFPSVQTRLGRTKPIWLNYIRHRGAGGTRNDMHLLTPHALSYLVLDNEQRTERYETIVDGRQLLQVHHHLRLPYHVHAPLMRITGSHTTLSTEPLYSRHNALGGWILSFAFVRRRKRAENRP